MRTSAASGQLEFSYGDNTGLSGFESLTRPRDERPTTSSISDFPTFDPLAQAHAVTSRRAGRINAASVSDEEHEALLRERQSLLDKKFAGTISRREELRLEYVRWSLDRIDDAKYGQDLDVLEAYTAEYENFLSYIETLSKELHGHKK